MKRPGLGILVAGAMIFASVAAWAQMTGGGGGPTDVVPMSTGGGSPAAGSPGVPGTIGHPVGTAEPALPVGRGGSPNGGAAESLNPSVRPPGPGKP